MIILYAERGVHEMDETGNYIAVRKILRVPGCVELQIMKH